MRQLAAYWKARSYAGKLTPQNYRDLVHDAYIVWYNKTQRDLFTEHVGVITKTIKNIYFSSYIKNKTYSYNGVRYAKEFIPIDEDLNPITTYDNPIEILIRKEERLKRLVRLQQIRNDLTEKEKQVFDLTVEGYSTKEIKEELNISTAVLSHKICNIKKKII